MDNEKKLFLAEPKLDSELDKYVIEIETEDNEKLLLGHMVDNIFMEYEKFDTEEEAIKSIQDDKRLKLRERKFKPGTYRHFKGKLYQAYQIVEHSETGEELVLYRALYGENKVYVRPLDMFMSITDKKLYPKENQYYRFKLVKESEN